MFGKGPVVSCLLKVAIGANRCQSVVRVVRETVIRFSFENSVSQIQLEMATSTCLLNEKYHLKFDSVFVAG